MESFAPLNQAACWEQNIKEQLFLDKNISAFVKFIDV